VQGVIRRLYRSQLPARLFHTTLYCLQRELRDCESVLDLGCGPNSPVAACPGLKRTVGVEAFEPYLRTARERATHDELIGKKIQELDFPPRSFDAVVLIEVIEHLPEAEAYEVLKLAIGWARKKVIVTSPNGFVPQKAVDGNDLQVHLSGWELRKMKRLGFHSRGLAGLRFLRQEVHSDTMGDDLLTSIRWRPRPFWFVVATLSQLATYRLPAVAFGLFSVKRVDRAASPSKQISVTVGTSNGSVASAGGHEGS
jgi:SAM-dependent methyltransferase